jgi:hypothetical protein
MGFVKDIVGGLTGSTAAKAATQAAGVQSAASDKAIDFQREALDKQLALTKPYTDLGASNTTKLQDLINDPQKQLDYVQNNPFFNALATKAQTGILNNAATKGKLGSGGTQEALQNSLLLLGNDLLQQQIGNTQNLVTIGSNAATGQASTIGNNADNVGNLTLASGQAQANGLIGAANAKTSAFQNLLNTGAQAAIAACDERLKENIIKVGATDKGFPLYLFNYIGDDKKQINVMAQDVEKTMPAAVIEYDGYKYVNMEMVYGS